MPKFLGCRPSGSYPRPLVTWTCSQIKPDTCSNRSRGQFHLVSALLRHVDYFRFARNPSRINAKRGDRFLQADFTRTNAAMQADSPGLGRSPGE